MLLWRIYVAVNNKMRIGIHVKCLIFVSDLTKFGDSGRSLVNYPNIKTSRKFPQVTAALICAVGQTDIYAEGHEEASGRFSWLCERALKTKYAVL